jgi:hypothetical protein
MTPNIEELRKLAELVYSGSCKAIDVVDYRERTEPAKVIALIDALQSQAERISGLESELSQTKETLYKHYSEKMQLRAQIAEIAATEPVAWQHVFTNGRSLSYSETVAGFPAKRDAETVEPLFTRPMPADVTELVDALEALIESVVGVDQVSAINDARTALSKYKGAK